jgi:glycosyltransferase involved in cell wall biosynthesis
MTCTVLAPTYARAEQLPDCLRALRSQERRPDQIIVVCRPDDGASRAVLADFAEVQEVPVTRAGLVPALAAGMKAATGDVVVTTDDYAQARPDWLASLLRHYADSTVGAVGGRDVVHHDWGVETGRAARVGTVRWFGRMEGRHHLGFGEPRDVHFLKGVNASVRRELFRLPMGLKGTSAYDETYVLSSLMPRMRRRRAAYGLLLGDRATVGLGRAAAARLRGEKELQGLLLPTAGAVPRATRDARTRPLPMTVDP